MRSKFILIIICIFSALKTSILMAQTIKTIHIEENSDINTLLGEDRYNIDSLIITGNVRHSDLDALYECCLNGQLAGIDMSNATIKNGEIPEYAFNRSGRFLYNLRYFKFPKNVTSIGKFAFESTGLEQLVIPNSINSIGMGAFRNCEKIKGTVIIPIGVSRIEHQTFQLCQSIEHLVIPSSVKYIGAMSIASMPNLKEIILPENLEVIMPYAFGNNPMITKITIPSSIKKIHWQFLTNCDNMKNIYVDCKQPPLLETSDELTRSLNGNMGINNDAVLFVPIGSKDAYKDAEYWRDFSIIKEAANLHPEKMVVEGRQWKYRVIENSDNASEFYISIGNDTIFDGVYCNKVYYSDRFFKKHIGYIYETNDRKVYMYNTMRLDEAFFMHEGWRKVHDFSLNIGDNASYIDLNGSEVILNVTGLWKIIVNGSEYKCWQTKYDTGYPAYRYVDGIGSNKYGVFGDTSLNINGFPQYQFVACYDKDVCIFEAKDFNAEAITDAISQIYKEPTNNNYLYDLQGRKVENPTKGLYIKEGKKVLVK